MAIIPSAPSPRPRKRPLPRRPRRVTILGSTGSIGTNTIDLIERQPQDFEVEALTANTNVAKLAEQARRLKPRTAVIADPTRYRELKAAL